MGFVGLSNQPLRCSSERWNTWKHSGFTVHRSRRIQPGERNDLECVVRCIIRNPFLTANMEFKPPNVVNAKGTVIYRARW